MDNPKYLPLLAEGFAKAAHFGQVRKYTGEPYYVHCREVAFIVGLTDARPCVEAAAWLHDVLEDTQVTEAYLLDVFGREVTELVKEVTDISLPHDGNRTRRKEIDRNHLALSSRNGATIKLADLIHNTHSITKYDPDFAKIYLEEKAMLLEVLQHGNRELWQKARVTLMSAQQLLNAGVKNGGTA